VCVHLISALTPEAAVVALLIGAPALGAAVRRWSALLVPVVAWPVYFVGLNREWWFYGTGDGWQYGAVVLTAVGVVTTGVAITVGRRMWPSR
jgi:hypothetical protein